MRLGEIGLPPPEYVLSGVDVTDATKQKMDLRGHGPFAQSRSSYGTTSVFSAPARTPYSEMSQAK